MIPGNVSKGTRTMKQKKTKQQQQKASPWAPKDMSPWGSVVECPKLLWPLLPSLLTSGSHEFLVEPIAQPIAQEPGGDESSSRGPGQHFLSVRKVVCRDTKVVQSSQTVLSSSGLLNLPV